MKKSKDIENTIEATFDVLDTINDVNVSPFFKDKTMQRLFTKEEEAVATGYSWFTPKLQFATLVCIVIINALGILQLTKASYTDSITEFANSYELSQDEQSSLFN